MKLKLPSLARRLSKLGRRSSSTDKNKSPGSPGGPETVESTTSPLSATGSSMTAADESQASAAFKSKLFKLV